MLETVGKSNVLRLQRPARNMEIGGLQQVFIGFPQASMLLQYGSKKIKPLFNLPGFMHLIAAHVIWNENHGIDHERRERCG